MNDHVGCSLLKSPYSSVTISLGSLVSEHFEIAALNQCVLEIKYFYKVRLLDSEKDASIWLVPSNNGFRP